MSGDKRLLVVEDNNETQLIIKVALRNHLLDIINSGRTISLPKTTLMIGFARYSS
jgi:hypothetical protein